MSAPTPCDPCPSLMVPLVPVGVAPNSNGRSAAREAQWDSLGEQLVRLRNLPVDWDGQGSLAPNPENVEQALRWLAEMRRWPRSLPPTCVTPGTTGEIAVEWRQNAFQLIAEIASPDRVAWLLNLPGQPMRQWETDLRAPWMVLSEG
mgnify:CR=1 FL=1